MTKFTSLAKANAEIDWLNKELDSISEKLKNQIELVKLLEYEVDYLNNKNPYNYEQIVKENKELLEEVKTLRVLKNLVDFFTKK